MKRTALAGLAVCLALFTGSVALAAPAATTPTPAAAPKAEAPKHPAAKHVVKAKKPKAFDWAGTWSGSINQVGRGKPFMIEVTLNGRSGKTTYPGQNCTGKLVRVGTSGSYAFFTETITEGKLDPTTKTGCLDGSLTLEHDEASNGLTLAWMTAHDGTPIVAYGILAPTK